MKEKLNDLLKDKLKEMNLFIDDVYEEVEGGNKFLRIVIDRENDYIDLNTISDISEIINQLIDDNNLVDEELIVDIYARTKGEE